MATGWIDPLRAATTIQDTVSAAFGALAKLSRASIVGAPIVETIIGGPDGTDPVWRLSHAGADLLRRLDGQVNPTRVWPSRERVAASYAKARGRISSTELASLVGAYASNVGTVLKWLEEDGVLARHGPPGAVQASTSATSESRREFTGLAGEKAALTRRALRRLRDATPTRRGSRCGDMRAIWNGTIIAE